MTSPAGPLSALNFRDVGGIAVAGGRLRRGLLYRSEGPANVDQAAHDALLQLGIRLVCDLRSTAEHQALSGKGGWGARLLNYDIANDFRAEKGADWRTLGSSPSGEQVRSRMIATYRAMPVALKPHLGGLVEAMASRDLPLLVHCTAGKDRTGVLMALLLRLLGADDEAILHDYLLSHSFGAAERNRERVRRQLGRILNTTIDDEALDAVIGVDPEYLIAALQGIDERWGSFEAYLADANVTPDVATQLGKLMIEE